MAVSRRQLVVLGAILVVLALVLYRQSVPPEITPEEFSASMSQRAPGAGPGLEAPSPAARRARPAAPAGIPPVALDSLGRAQPEPADSGRDPFRFDAAQRTGLAGSSAGRDTPAPAAVVPAGPVGPAGPIEPPGPPPILLKFIGIARQGQGRMYAVLRDDRGVYYGAEGDVIEGRFRILRVSVDTVDVSYTDGRGRTSIPLSGGRP